MVFFGAGNIAAKTSRIVPFPPFGIADNDSNLWGDEQLGVKVFSPAMLAEEPGKHYVIITTTSYVEVSEQLIALGLKPLRDFAVSPILNDIKIIHELQSVRRKLLATSGAPPLENELFGGGLYEMLIDGNDFNYRKLVSGKCYGLTKARDHVYLVNHQEGLLCLDADYQIVHRAPLPEGSSPHGITYSELTECFYVVASYLDAVLVFDAQLNHVDTLSLSNKLKLEGAPAHHANDILAIGNSLFVSMFSLSGNWKKEVFDGSILEFEIPSHRLVGPLIQNLWMPHNVAFLGGSLTVLNSLKGELLRNNFQVVGAFPAFTRGLDYDGIFFYVGQSRNRNFSRTLGVSKNISIDTAIIIFDERTHVSRSFQLPHEFSEIHSIVIC